MTLNRLYPPHSPRIAPAASPGGFYVRIATHDDELLAEHAIDTGTRRAVERVARHDQDLAFAWLRRNPTGVLYHYVYDGDSGDCLKTIILAASDVRAFEKGLFQPEPEPELRVEAAHKEPAEAHA